MPRKVVVIDYRKCHPKHCDGGSCAAALACPKKLIKQEAPYGVPMPSPSPCPSCVKCALACPLKAIVLM